MSEAQNSPSQACGNALACEKHEIRRARCGNTWHVKNAKFNMPRCVEAPWHIKNTKVDEAGCVETPWHVEPYPFVAIHVENRRGGVEPSPFTAIRIENRGGFEPPHFDPGKVVSRKREKKECCGTPLVPAFPLLITNYRSLAALSGSILAPSMTINRRFQPFVGGWNLRLIVIPSTHIKLHKARCGDRCARFVSWQTPKATTRQLVWVIFW
jgi:hypothetical protein